MNSFTRSPFALFTMAAFAWNAPASIVAQTPIPASTISAPAVAPAPAEASGYFTVAKQDGRWWLIDGHGRRFISKGVTTVDYTQDVKVRGGNDSPYRETNRAKYASVDAWRANAARRLLDWNFNSLGAWSDPALARLDTDGHNLAYAPVLNLGARFVSEITKPDKAGQAWLNGIFPDVFDPRFASFVLKVAAEKCTPLASDTRILGWFTDNELRWNPDWRTHEELLVSFVNNPDGTPGREAAFALLKRRHATIADFNATWKTTFASWLEAWHAPIIANPYVRKQIYQQNAEQERTLNEADPARARFVGDCEAFTALVAEEYFRITTHAIKAVAPHHLVFGCRFAYVPSPPVIAAASRHLDVISFNSYAFDPTQAIRNYAVFERPLIIGEFSFRGADSGLPNTKGAGPVVKTQADRAAAFRAYVHAAMVQPNVVGYHWFEHADEPAEGRFDGENSNYGVVNIKDEPYEVLVRTMTEVNALAETWHAGK